MTHSMLQPVSFSMTECIRQYWSGEACVSTPHSAAFRLRTMRRKRGLSAHCLAGSVLSALRLFNRMCAAYLVEIADANDACSQRLGFTLNGAMRQGAHPRAVGRRPGVGRGGEVAWLCVFIAVSIHRPAERSSRTARAFGCRTLNQPPHKEYHQVHRHVCSCVSRHVWDVMGSLLRIGMNGGDGFLPLLATRGYVVALAVHVRTEV